MHDELLFGTEWPVSNDDQIEMPGSRRRQVGKANPMPNDRPHGERKTRDLLKPNPGNEFRKSAEWWGLGQEKRAAMMQEHTAATLPYLKTVKRKLYHSSGLDDLDFITYFETSKLEDFHSLVLSLEKVKEFQHTRQFGNPTLLGTVQSLDEIIETLAQ